jgi:hypothetical protein
MRQDFVTVYGDRGRKVMEAVNKVEATCGTHVQHKRYSGTGKESERASE